MLQDIPAERATNATFWFLATRMMVRLCSLPRFASSYKGGRASARFCDHSEVTHASQGSKNWLFGWVVGGRALETGGFTTGENGEATGYWAPKAPEKPKLPPEIQAKPPDYPVDT